jgi:hypothetical protein
MYQVKVTLSGTDPPIRRRMLVPAGINLRDFHVVLQIATSWGFQHL